jgi:single-strand DNA-binding protein
MNTLNSILIEGNVVNDAIVRETPTGSLVCNFSIASNRYYKQDDEFEQETSYFEIETWSKLAESCGKCCLKGRGVRISGRIKQNKWTDSEGKNQSKIIVIAEHVEFKPVKS